MKLMILASTALLMVAGPAYAIDEAATQEVTFTNGDSSGAGTATADVEGGSVSFGADLTTAGEDGVEGSEPEAAPEPPVGHWISVSDLIYVFDPPCVRTSWTFHEDMTDEEADAEQQRQEDLFVAEYEAYISGGSAPPPACPRPDGTPAIDPTPAIDYADDAATLLPVADPTIAGGYAITGMRSWVDLGGARTFTDSRQLDLGPFTRTATFTATATATVDWGDGTVTTHTARGGGYHAGEPGSEDVTHIYRDAAESVTLRVTDTWRITVSVPGLDDIVIDYTATPVTRSYAVREVRSQRDA